MSSSFLLSRFVYSFINETQGTQKETLVSLVTAGSIAVRTSDAAQYQICGLYFLDGWFNFPSSSDLGSPLSEVMLAEIPTSFSELENVRMIWFSWKLFKLVISLGPQSGLGCVYSRDSNL